jgi:hypothetical protein
VTEPPPQNRETDRSSESPLEVVLLTEKRDEGAIIAEMRGEIVDTYVYSFQQGNRTITNLASPGVKEAIRRRGNVAIIPCPHCNQYAHVEEVNGEFRATVKIHDLKNNVQFLGTSTCKTNMPFAYVVAVNKAERNGFRKLLPEKEIALLIKEWGKSPSKQSGSKSGWTDNTGR